MDTETIKSLLGMRNPIPFSRQEMASSLQVWFYPGSTLTPKLAALEKRLCQLLTSSGVQILPRERAITEGDPARIRAGVVTMVIGEVVGTDLPISSVSSLANNIVVQILDRPCPARDHSTSQANLNAVMSDMAWHFAHVVIYVESTDVLTVCNMNGAIITCRHDEELAEALIPKLAAPVVPPRARDFEFCPNGFDPHDTKHQNAVRDLVESGQIWAATGLMVAQTPVSTLRFRNTLYRKLGGIYLDHRTGMSYGFLARQLPIHSLTPARTIHEARSEFGIEVGEDLGLFEHDGQQYIGVRAAGQYYVVPVPEVWVLSTRSGCEKTQLNPSRDLVRYGLRRGQVIFQTPSGIDEATDCKPSYDTLVIVAHAIANAINASVLARIEPGSALFTQLRSDGLALAHWHGFLSDEQLPDGYPIHGIGNPAVSCSTPQSAILAVAGKVQLLSRSPVLPIRGDIHIEPHHGTNFTCSSLVRLANWLLASRNPASNPTVSPSL